MPPPAATSRRSGPLPARWTVRTADERVARALAEKLSLHPAVARVLAAREWTDCDAAREFLDPKLAAMRDPLELRDMDRAVERTLRAVRGGEKIAIFGDYDVDGVCSTALMLLTLRRLGADPLHFIPHRVHDGYGMSRERVEELAKAGAKLLLTVDTGVTAIDQILRANELGMEVIVTDHHLPEGHLPAAFAVVNPNRPDARYEGGSLCGTGVAFKFAHALLKGAGLDAAESRGFLRELLDLVALATVADVVPLRGENRVLVHHGLRALAETKRPGLRALMAENRLSGVTLTTHHIGFILGPRLNAAGRTDHASSALDLILTSCPNTALQLAQHLNSLNRMRRDEESAILTHAVAQAERQIADGRDSCLVVAGEDYHIGVVGIVAARLAEQFHRPALVLRLESGMAKGSARSIPGFDVHEALCACHDHLASYGGHAAAAGLQVEPARLDGFRTAINAHAARHFAERDLSPELVVDAELDADDITWPFYRDLQRLQPFGQDNPAPHFLLRGARPASPARIVGDNHLKLNLRVGSGTFSAIGFRLGRMLNLCQSAIDIVFRPSENTWEGRTTIQLEIQDLRPATSRGEG